MKHDNNEQETSSEGCIKIHPAYATLYANNSKLDGYENCKHIMLIDKHNTYLYVSEKKFIKIYKVMMKRKIN